MTDIILESISDGVFTVDAEWRVTSFNKAAERITGINRGEAIGKLCHEVFKSNMCEGECPLRRTMRTGKPIIDKKGYCLNPKGERIPISVSTALLIDEEGKTAGGAETFRDLRELEELKERLQARSVEGAYSSRSPAMHRIVELLPTIAGSASSVLIEGETGTGKEVTARAIHRLSDRANGPFIAVNCGALPDTLLESELFGYKKGAFTGADKDKPGRFKLAQNGTLFLDEIGDISQALQVKLLRVLQEREYEPLGSTATEKTNARLLFAANKDLAELVNMGLFRQDLYYRINVIGLSLPPLRERVEDIPQLAETFLRTYAKAAGKEIRGFAPEVFAAFYAYGWPGNIRELENVVERAVVLCGKGEIDLGLLPPAVMDAAAHGGHIVRVSREKRSDDPARGPAPVDIRAGRGDFERRLVIDTLRRNGNKCAPAAHELGIDKATLYRKLKHLDIDLNAIRKNET